MPLEAGTKLGPYEIVSPIGKGGMGEVYRARDTKLDRDVAIKVLPEELAADEDLVARFEREAKLLASLNHPNIASIHGLEESDGVRALVLELIEGPTLAERIQQGPIAVDEAIAISKQIAEALEAGHEAGVIHRDLKPANIKVKEDGTVKVLDYGLAKALGPDSSSSSPAAGDDLSNSPTLAHHATQMGMIMGTAAYMAPEQARGKPVDKRADIWSFGVVLYEMLTGRRAFEGEDASMTLASVIKSEPALESIPTDVPLHVRTVLHRCLEKDARQRIRDIGDVRLALDGAFETERASPVPFDAPRARDSWNRLTVAFASLFLLAAGIAGWSLLEPEAPRRVARFESPFRDGQAPMGPIKLTSDGRAVYVGLGVSPGGSGPVPRDSTVLSNQTSALWLRSWGELDARPIPGTDGVRTRLDANGLGLSPDGREVAFATGEGGPLRVVPLAGGPSRTLAESAYNASWSRGGWIYFTSGPDFGIDRVRSSGGRSETVTKRTEGESFHIFPEPLPDGEALLFQAVRSIDGSDAEIWSIDLETKERKQIAIGTNPRYTASGHLLFGASNGTLMAAAFDPARAAITGAAVPIAEGLLTSNRGNLVYDASDEGTLFYITGEAMTRTSEFVWVTRAGDATPIDPGESFTPPQPDFRGWRLSPDGSRIAFAQNVEGNDDVWIKELPDGPVSRLTFSSAMDSFPQWAPDGRSITYRNGTQLTGSLWSIRADGTGEPELVFDETDIKKGFWNPDGDWLVLRSTENEPASRDILAVRPGVEGASIPLVATEEFWEQAPAISRDGRWIAYSSDETGRNEIFVRPFPNVDDGKWPISTGGGIQPVWAHNGRELFFANPDTRELQAVEFTTTSTTFDRARVTTLFVIPEGTLFDGSATGNSEFYDVSLDDQRFLMARWYGADDAAPSNELVLNFFEELERLAPN